MHNLPECLKVIKNEKIAKSERRNNLIETALRFRDVIWILFSSSISCRRLTRFWPTRRVLEIKPLKMKKKTVKTAAVAEKETQLKESDTKEVSVEKYLGNSKH